MVTKGLKGKKNQKETQQTKKKPNHHKPNNRTFPEQTHTHTGSPFELCSSRAVMQQHHAAAGFAASLEEGFRMAHS